MARVGTDIVEISRIKDLAKRERFLDRVFTEDELAYQRTRGMKAQTLAGAFASKEAVAKLIGTGIGKVSFKDIEIFANKSGRPYIRLSQKAKDLAKGFGIRGMDLTISHDGGMAIAIATEDWAYEEELIEKLDQDPSLRLKARPSNSHKGDYGRLGLIGGSKGMAGSILMSSMAALRTGSGLVYTWVPEDIVKIAQIKSLENIVLSLGYLDRQKDREEALESLKTYQALALGPGMGREEGVLDLLKEVLDLDMEMVIDGDGLFALAKDPGITRGKKTIITPHHKEMERLTGKNLDAIRKDPRTIAEDFAKNYETIVVLKGHNTVVTDGDNTYINRTGNPGMATAGSGDVLTGIISSFLGQGYGLFESAKLGVFIHGLAGDFAANDLGEDSMVATDIIKHISQAIRTVRRWT